MAKEPIKKVKEDKNKEKAKKTIVKKATTKRIDTQNKKASSKSVSKTKSKSEVASKSTLRVKSHTDTKKSVSSTTKMTPSKTNKLKIKPTAKPMLAEYYDLPYRYNQTTVKILAQTPTTLFVYWDVSDDDRNILMNKHGDNLFHDTIPILLVHNITKNYSFEIQINDFANSWYIRTQEPNCDYVVELVRKRINDNNEYIHIYSSNEIVSPNDHVLFEKSDLGNIVFRNVKTGSISSKDFGSLRFINDIDKLYGNVYDVYSRLYKDETLNEIANPTSGEFANRFI